MNYPVVNEYRNQDAIVAFFVGALSVSILFSVFSQSLKLMTTVLFVATAHGVLALPIYAYLKYSKCVNLLSTGVSGFLIGALPVGLISFPLLRGKGSSASINGVPTLIDGIPTLAGWISHLKGMLFFGVIGLIAAAIFWVTLKHLTSRRINERKPLLTSVLVWGTVALFLAIVFIPTITKDRTCHNSLRDGRSSISPVVHFELSVSMGEWENVRKIFSKFAKEHNFSFKDSSESEPNLFETLYLSVCLEPGLQISTVNQRWAMQEYKGPGGNNNIRISVYLSDESVDWRPLVLDFVERIENVWPEKVIFKDKNGRKISREKTNLNE